MKGSSDALERVAWVRLGEGLGDERPIITAEVATRSRRFSRLDRAVRWAQLRADRVSVIVDGLGRWSAGRVPYDTWPAWPVDGVERQRVEQWVQRRLTRFDREHRTRFPEPVEWFYAVREPDVEDREGLAEVLGGQSEVVSARLDERGWYVVRLRERTLREAAAAGVDVFVRLAWPDERLLREHGHGREEFSYVVGHGGQAVAGLAEFEEEHLDEASRWR